MTVKERAEKYLEEHGRTGGSSLKTIEAFEAGFRAAIALALAGVEREKQYHEFLEEQGEMRHPILACKGIAGYLRTLAESETPPGACL